MHAAAGHLDRRFRDLVGGAQPVEVPRVGVEDRAAAASAAAPAGRRRRGRRLLGARERRIAEHAAPASVAIRLVWKNSRRSMDVLGCRYFSANATIFVFGAGSVRAGMWNAASPPPATADDVLLAVGAHDTSAASSSTSSSSVAFHSSLPVLPSNARKPKSPVAPMKTSPLAVAIGPPSFSAVPVPLMPFAVEIRVLAERRAPHDVAGARADGDELRPRRRVARIPLRIGVEGRRELRLARTTAARRTTCSLQLRDDAEVPRVDEDQPERRVGRDAAPAAAAFRARKHEARHHAVRRVRARC